MALPSGPGVTVVQKLVDAPQYAPTAGLIRRLLSTDIGDPRSEAALAIRRVGVGVVVATLHGWHKVIEGWHHLTAAGEWPLLHDTIHLGFPLPAVFATLAALSQFIGGSLLAIGAFTRVAAFLVASTMATAVVFNLQVGGPDAQLAALYALVTGTFVVTGGGRWSVDRRLVG